MPCRLTFTESRLSMMQKLSGSASLSICSCVRLHTTAVLHSCYQRAAQLPCTQALKADNAMDSSSGKDSRCTAGWARWPRRLAAARLPAVAAAGLCSSVKAVGR